MLVMENLFYDRKIDKVTKQHESTAAILYSDWKTEGIGLPVVLRMLNLNNKHGTNMAPY